MLPVVVLTLASLRRGVLVPRSLMPFAWGGPLALGALAGLACERSRAWGATVVVLLAVLCIPAVSTAVSRDEGTGVAMASVREVVGADGIVFMSDRWQHESLVEWYQFASLGTHIRRWEIPGGSAGRGVGCRPAAACSVLALRAGRCRGPCARGVRTDASPRRRLHPAMRRARQGPGRVRLVSVPVPGAQEVRDQPGGVRRGPTASIRVWLARPVVAGVALLLCYVAASFFMDPMGSLGTDTGGKVATMEVMAQRPLGLDPDVGYWAAEIEPDAELHGLFYTTPIGERFVNVTTLPMLELGAPLYRIGGYRLALLLPMLGAVAAAFAGRRLAVLVGADDRTAWWAFWVLGLASPLAIYALDFWEHAPGVALLLWGVVALLVTVDEGRRLTSLWWGVCAGVAFGAAYSMRTEALVYGFVATAVVSVYLLWSRRWREALGSGLGVVGGLVVAVMATTALEVVAVGESLRSGRASGTAEAGGSGMELRFKEAVVTGAGLFAEVTPRALVVAGVLAVALLVAAFFAGREGGGRIAAGAAAVAVGLFLMRVAQDVGFVPGLMAAAPLAAVGIARMPANRNARLLGVIALGALPLVWLFQFTGGAGPQWAGRYILTSGALLLILGVAALPDLPSWGRRYFVTASIVVTLVGVLWLSERSHGVAEAARDVAAFPEDVVISTQAFWLRELGAVYEGDGTRWLSVRDESVLDDALDIVVESDVESFALVGVGEEPRDLPAVDGFAVVDQRNYSWLGVPFVAVSYDRVD